ncbi:biotin--[acetyl-CoA-carboxylase] ligase [candidate division WOR-3 bacterium]|nr:biotin--[acetyl-CoA-carboxylase] ligase [candidate division WOR-3 bacterium]
MNIFYANMKDLTEFVEQYKYKDFFWNGKVIKIVFLEKIDSTNSYALNELDDDETEYLVISDSQTGGRGQKDNKWESPPSKGLYFSLLLHPHIKADSLATIPLTWGKMVARTIETLANIKTQIKEPNDVLSGNRKIAGILIENKIYGDICKTLIAGIGVNINNTPEDFPEKLRNSATSLYIETGKNHSRSDFLRLFFKLNSRLNF